MSDTVESTRPDRAGSEESHSESPGRLDPPSDNKPARRDGTEGNHLVGRILNTPGLEHVVPRLQPDLLHRVIQTCGLQDCSELVALATSEQLEGIFDLDLWHAGGPGMDEQFDPDRFGLWIEVLAEAGAEVAAEKLAGMHVDLVVAGLAQHMLVYDRAAVTPYETLDGELIEVSSADGDRITFDMGSYLLVAKRADSWESLIEVLLALGDRHPYYFGQVMDSCRTLSNSGRELDGLDELLADDDQALFDVAVDREGRREKQGYVTPAQARAFLQMAREFSFDSAAMPPPNPLADAYFQALRSDSGPSEAKTGMKPLAEDLNAENEDRHRDHEKETVFPSSGPKSARSPETRQELSRDAASEEEIAAVEASIFNTLREAGILQNQPRALLAVPEGASRLGLIQAHMQFALDRDQAAYSARNEELAYLANTLIAGCSIQGRPFTGREASDAALAVCNLGLENWPLHLLPANKPGLPASFLVDHDLVSVFQIGWAVLHNEVIMYSAEHLIEALTAMRDGDPETQVWLERLRRRMVKHWRAGAPWRARDELEVIAILDMTAWAVLLGLIDECPVLHPLADTSKNSRTLCTASDFEFISENSQVTCIHEFMQWIRQLK